MNRLQKKIITIVMSLANITLTGVVAGTATYAWFKASANVEVGSNKTVNIGSKTDSPVTWEVLSFDDDQKSGVTSASAADFYLRPYDEYLTTKNKYSNVLLRSTVNVSGSNFTSGKQLYIDITCSASSAFDYASATSTGVPSYTSNISQFKASVASYLADDDSDYTTVNESIIETNANTKYTSSSSFFTQSDTNAKFVALHNQTPYKKKNTITLIPTFDCGSDKVDYINVYLECSYNPDLVSYYLSTHSSLSGEIALAGDITDITFRVGDAYEGAYVKVGSQTPLDSDGDYLVVFDEYKTALDGSLASSNLTSGQNYIDVNNKKNRVANDENTYPSRVSYNTSTQKLTTASGLVIGRNSSGMGASKTGSYTNTLTYDSGYVEAVSAYNGTNYSLRYNTTRGDTRFSYYNNTQSQVSFYKYDENAVADIHVTSIVLDGNQKVTFYEGDDFTFEPGHVTAIYSDGSSLDVTSSCTFTGYDMSAITTQEVVVSFTEDGILKTTTYNISVIKAPKVDLNFEHLNGIVGGTYTGLVATASYFTGSPLTYVWSSTDSTKANVTGDGANPTLSYLAATDEVTVSVTVSTTLGESASASCTIKITEPVVSTATYTVATTSSVTTSGTVPGGSSATFANTYTSANQITSGNSATLTLSGYDGTTITGLTLNMHSNASKGAGSFSFTIGSTSIASLSSGTTFDNWFNSGSYSDTYKDVAVTMSPASQTVGTGEEITITINCTTNSLYINSYTVSYTSAVAKQLSSIAVTTAKTNFYMGDSFENPSVITATYDDGSTSTIAASKCTISGYNMSTTGTQTVTVSYTEDDITRETTYTITVNEVLLDSITVSGAKTSFYAGDAFATTGLVVTAHYNNSSTKTVTSSATISGPTSAQMSVARTYTVTVSYTEGSITKSATYEITVNAVAMTGISVKTNPTTTTYNVGDTFDPTGLVLNAIYNNGTSQEITSGYTYKTTGLTADDTSFTISYNGFNTTVTLTIKAAIVTLDNTTLEGIEGGTGTLTATPSNFSGTPTYTWSSSNQSAVTVSGSGANATLSYAGAGTSTITVSASDGSQTATATCEVTVTALSITLSDTSMTLAVDDIAELTVTTNGTVTSVTSSDTSNTYVEAEWSSGNTINIYGYAVTSTPVTVTVTVSHGTAPKTATCTVSVTASKVLSSIAVSGMTTSFAQNSEFSFDGICTATYSDGTTAEVTPTVTGVSTATVGTQTATVSYTEGEITKTTTYDVTITAAETEHTITFTFTDKSFSDSTSGWTCTTAAFGFDSTKGIQRTSGTAEAVTKVSYKVTAITMQAATTSKGVGTYTFKVGTTTVGTQSLSKSSTVTSYSICSGISITGTVTVTMNCTTNSLYLKTITITYLA